ncbi:MAG TPA: LysR substrate-binding domain-containing protein [Solirubrobacterales bacterium]
MSPTLDIVPLRSFVAIAETGGFHRAGTRLSLTQSAVSQHVRKLEMVIGERLVQPSGRGTRFTAAGEVMLIEARKILEVHDRALERFVGREERTVVIGATEHASDAILPPLMARLGDRFPELDIQFRFDRTARLQDAVEQGMIDVAVFVSEADHDDGNGVGALPVRWCASPGWVPPAGGPLPLVAIQAPCAIRASALSVLAAHDISARVVGDAANLGGVLNAARAGLGVALVACAAALPEGLVELSDLPPAPPVALAARVREGGAGEVTETVLEVLRSNLAGVPAATPVAGCG